MTPREAATSQPLPPEAPKMPQATDAANPTTYEKHPGREKLENLAAVAGNLAVLGTVAGAVVGAGVGLWKLAEMGYGAIHPIVHNLDPVKAIAATALVLGGAALRSYYLWRKDNPKPELPAAEPTPTEE